MKASFGAIAIMILLLVGCTSQPQSEYSQALIANERDVAAQQASIEAKTEAGQQEETPEGITTLSRTCRAANSYSRAERWLTYVAMSIADFFVPSYNGNDSDLPEPVEDDWNDRPSRPDIVCEE